MPLKSRQREDSIVKESAVSTEQIERGIAKRLNFIKFERQMIIALRDICSAQQAGVLRRMELDLCRCKARYLDELMRKCYKASGSGNIRLGFAIAFSQIGSWRHLSQKHIDGRKCEHFRPPLPSDRFASRIELNLTVTNI